MCKYERYRLRTGYGHRWRTTVQNCLLKLCNIPLVSGKTVSSSNYFNLTASKFILEFGLFNLTASEFISELGLREIWGKYSKQERNAAKFYQELKAKALTYMGYVKISVIYWPSGNLRL